MTWQLVCIAIAAFSICLGFALWFIPERTADLDDEDHHIPTRDKTRAWPLWGWCDYDGTKPPWYLGIAYSNIMIPRAFLLPVPVNFIVFYTLEFYWYLRNPSRTRRLRALRRMYRKGYHAGSRGEQRGLW